MFTISAFADEISPDPQQQLDVLDACGVRHIEFRSILGTNVLTLTDLQVREFKALLDARGFRLSAIGSPIGKIRIDEPFEAHLEKFKRAIELCKLFDTPNIRVFSYYPAEGSADWQMWRAEVMSRLMRQCELAEAAGVRLVHENEHRIYGDSPDRVVDLLNTLGQRYFPKTFGAVYDAANYVFCGYDPWEGWQRTKRWTVHFHIKDWIAGAKHGSIPGEGQGRIPESIADAVKLGYDGFATMEPHLLGGGPTGGVTGPELFPKAVAAFKRILDQAGAAYQVSAKLQQVHVRVNDAATGKPTPCRVRFTDAEGNYYAPFGRSTKFPADIKNQIAGNLYIGGQPHAYIDGSCEIGLPPGMIHVTIAKGPEYEEIDKSIPLAPGKLALRFELKRLIDPACEGWHAGVIAVTTLSPHDVLLEGAAEGLRAIDLLAFERETPTAVDYPNLIAFSGQRACVENSECLVAVNTLNGHFVLGGLALLNSHRPVFPIRFGRSRLGEPSPDNWSLADWCDQCHRKRGLVIGLDVAWWEKWSGGEGLADIILGKVDAIGLGELFVESIQWWYTLLSLGLQAPIVAGIPARPLALISRTYAQLEAGQDFSYATWIAAIRAGRTVVSDGVFLTMTVNGEAPGTVVELMGKEAVVKVRAAARSRQEFHQLEIIRDGIAVVSAAPRHGAVFHAEIEAELPMAQSGWLAARCTDKPFPTFHQLYAHTSPVYVRIDHQPPPADPQAVRTVTDQLDRTLAWVEHDANCETPKDRERLVKVFVDAKQVLFGKLGQ